MEQVGVENAVQQRFLIALHAQILIKTGKIRQVGKAVRQCLTAVQIAADGHMILPTEQENMLQMLL